MNRFVALDGLRGVCALAVVLHHYPGRWVVPGAVIWENGWVFIDFFFVLSGFVMMHVYGHRLSSVPDLATFAWRRFWRLWPLHVAMLLPWAVIALVGPRRLVGFSADCCRLEDLPAHLALLNGFVSRDSWNHPAWSVSTEFVVYLLFAGISLLTPRRKLIAVAVVAAISVAWLSGFVDHMTVWRTLIGFCLGVLGYGLHTRLPAWSASAWTAAEVGIVLAVGFGAASLAGGPAELLLPFLFTGGVLVFARGEGQLSRLLSGRAGAWLGRISFSIYLTHFFILLMALSLASSWGFAEVFMAPGDHLMVRMGAVESAVILITSLLAIVGISALTERFIERPLYRWARRVQEVSRSRAAARQVGSRLSA